MVLLRQEKLDRYLHAIGRNKSWLAAQLGWSKGYVSQIRNNKCKISIDVVDKMLAFTHLSFEELFSNDGAPDRREFYGESIYNGFKIRHNLDYKKYLKKRLTSPKA